MTNCDLPYEECHIEGQRPGYLVKKTVSQIAIGSTSATRCGLDFFGPENVLFASDSPFDPEKGPGNIRETIEIIDRLDISEGERTQIYEGNARRLLKLELSE